MALVENSESALTRFSREISDLDLMPLWEREPGAMSPGTSAVPHLWRYQDLRPFLIRSTELISKKDAERRVLVLENPSLRGTTFVTNSLYAGLQVIKPGEIAPSHRHTPNALRFIVEGEGAYSAVGGERAAMHPGDFIVTPNWEWHDHGNLGSEPVVWLDGLDTPFGKFFGSMFREDYANDVHPVVRKDGESLAAYGNNMMPVDYETDNRESPILRYPYERSRDALYDLQQTGRLNPAQGLKLRYVNPANGQYPFRTMGVFMQLLPAGFEGRRYRSTDGAVFAVVEGTGTVIVGDKRYSVSPHDIFVVPPWTPYRFQAKQDMVLFSYSDRSAQKALGFWKEELLADD